MSHPRRLPRMLAPLMILGAAIVGNSPTHVALGMKAGAIDGDRKKQKKITSLSAREGRRGSKPLAPKVATKPADFARLGSAEAKRARKASRNARLNVGDSQQGEQ